jgi:hypothetical protein
MKRVSVDIITLASLPEYKKDRKKFLKIMHDFNIVKNTISY